MSRTPPTIATVAPGNYVTASLWNAQVGGIGSFALTPPMFSGIQTTAQSCPASFASTTALNLQTALIDTEGGWSSGTNPSQYVVQVAGKYLVRASVSFTFSGATNGGSASVMQNGNIVDIVISTCASGETWGGQCTTILTCNVGDFIQLGAMQGSSAALNTYVGSALFQPKLQILWLSE